MTIDQLLTCTEQTITRNVPLIGTASEDVRQYLFVEVPPPWPPKITDLFTEDLRAAYSDLLRTGASTKTHLIQPSPPHSVKDHRRVFFFHSPMGNIHEPFTKTEYLFPTQELEWSLTSLIRGEDLGLDQFKVPTHPNQRDLFLCVHGNRDRCCGSVGVALFNQAQRILRNSPNIRLWQSSHLTGHRMSPTLVDFPDGRFYGHLGLSELENIITEKKIGELLRRHYRGLSGLPKPLQVLEGAVFEQEGWGWRSQSFTYRAESEGNDATWVEIVSDRWVANGRVKKMPSVELGVSSCGNLGQFTPETLVELKITPH